MPLTPQDLDDVPFSRPRVRSGYRADEVDALLHRVVRVLTGESDPELLNDLRQPGFRMTRWWGRAYDRYEVDAMVDLCAHEVARVTDGRQDAAR